MLKTIAAVVRDGRIELLEPATLRDGARLLVTMLSDEEEEQFWVRASDHTLRPIWENAEDDIYCDLLQR